MANKNNQHAATDATLRQIFKTMDAHQAQEIREAYYKAVEGLRTLASALELADSETSGPEIDDLMNEHLLACQAMSIMNKSRLGAVL